jgi:hypothetical protein
MLRGNAAHDDGICAKVPRPRPERHCRPLLMRAAPIIVEADEPIVFRGQGKNPASPAAKRDAEGLRLGTLNHASFLRRGPGMFVQDLRSPSYRVPASWPCRTTRSNSACASFGTKVSRISLVTPAKPLDIARPCRGARTCRHLGRFARQMPAATACGRVATW